MPPIKICPQCGTKNESDAKFCENCGTKLKTRQNKDEISLNKKLVIIGIIVVIGLGIIVGLLLKGNSSSAMDNNATPEISQNSGIPVSTVPLLAEKVYNLKGDFVSIDLDSVTLDKNQCLYILAKAIVMIDQNNQGNIAINSYSGPDYPEGYITTTIITKSEYVDMAKRTYTWMDSNGQSPNYVGITTAGQPDLSPDTTLNLFAKVLTEYKSTGQLPASVSIP